MGKFDRCYICDYTIVEGSLFANVQPGENGIVRFNENLDNYICQTCEGTVIDNINLYELEEFECQSTTSHVPADNQATPILSSTTEEVIVTPENVEVNSSQVMVTK